jgi:ABC-type polysaccharide/polyol phosphate transport system ATPase subunit
MSDVHIQLKGVSLYYYTFNRGIHSVKDFVVSFGSKRLFEPKKVLENINLDISKGEVVGLVGKNGMGKSSLLKAVAGILKSYEGTVHVQGKLAPVLALGSGIEMELTGYENIRLICSLLGHSKTEMKTKIERVRDFSELSDEVLQLPVKTYSTGMMARLSFSIAITETPDILLIDEVLAVGDQGFQQKCFQRIQEIKATGCIILFVSHSEADIRSICTRAILLNNGTIQQDGSVDEVLDSYNQLF